MRSSFPQPAVRSARSVLKVIFALLLGITPVVVAGPQSVALTVTIPPGTPGDAAVYLAGSLPVVGAWKADGVKLQRQPDGTYATTLALDAGDVLEFKFNCGSWDTVEKRADGGDRENRTLTIAPGVTELTATVERWADAGPRPSTVVGTLKIHEIDSAVLKQHRTVRVWLPPGYDADAAARFGVLYLHDGQNCFDRRTSAFGDEWQVDETLTRLIADKTVRPLIVVAIDNVGPQRIDDYTFVADAKHGGGHGDAYARFLLDEVKALVEKTYRTKAGPADTFIGGASLGGLASIEIARRYPGVFGGVIAMSASAWWADAALARDLEKDGAGLAGTRVWLDVGTAELPDPVAAAATVADTRRVEAALMRHGVDHRLVVEPGAKHNEAAWAKRFPEAIVYVAGGA